MNIKIEHIPNTFNYGSCLMAITLINKINNEFTDVKFYVDTSTNKDFSRLKKELGIDNLYKYGVKSRKNFIGKCISKIKKFLNEKSIDKINNVIIIGGDDISEYYGVKGLIKEVNKLKKLSLRKNIILLGQTIGPFTENRDEITKECLKNTLIYTRDDKNFKYLKEMNFSNIKRGRDLAFMRLPMQDKRRYILSKYNLESNNYLTIVSSGLTNSYTQDISIYIKQQVNIIKNIMNNDKLKNKKIVLLPHVLLPVHVDDRLIIRDIMKKIDDKFKNRIIDIYDEMLPSEAREILGNGLFTITGRMHAAVSTFYMRKPAISLSYSVKYAGVIGDGLDMNELVIESANEQLWSNGEISKLVDEKVNYILDNYEKLVKKIDINVSETSKIVEEELNDVVNQIKNSITN